jgi:hypothetical protein
LNWVCSTIKRRHRKLADYALDEMKKQDPHPRRPRIIGEV